MTIMFFSNRDEMRKSYTGPSIHPPCKMLLYLVKWLQRRFNWPTIIVSDGHVCLQIGKNELWYCLGYVLFLEETSTYRKPPTCSKLGKFDHIYLNTNFITYISTQTLSHIPQHKLYHMYLNTSFITYTSTQALSHIPQHKLDHIYLNTNLITYTSTQTLSHIPQHKLITYTSKQTLSHIPQHKLDHIYLKTNFIKYPSTQTLSHIPQHKLYHIYLSTNFITYTSI